MRPHTLARRRALYEDARLLVEREHASPLTLAAVASALAVSPRQLQRAFAEAGATSFRDELTRRRLAAAARLLLASPGLAVREVAARVGYRGAPHFTQAFRLRYGLTPGELRRRGGTPASD
jgi:AraC-like DNA-binding protein